MATAIRALPGLAAGLLLHGAVAAVEIERVVSPGGIEAWLVAESSVPVLSLSFAFRGGAARDPVGKEGLANLVSGLLDEGAGEMDSTAFQAALDETAARLDFEAGRDRFGGTLGTLSAERGRAVRLLRLALTRPRFDPGPVARVRSQIVASLESRRDEPGRVARRRWSELAFGAHPYARPVEGTPESLARIARGDLVGFAGRQFARDRLVIGAAGDIAAADLGHLVDAVFGELPAGGAAAPLPEARPRGGRVEIVRKPIPQSVVVFGQAGVKRDDPDYYAAYVMNHILGGGFSSRLTQEIRQKRGLVYSVYSYLLPLDHAGLIVGGLATANARVAAALGLVRAEWRRLARDGVSAEELAAAKSYLDGSFPLRLDSTGAIADILVAIQAHGLGIDHIDRRAALIGAVTEADVRRVARRLLDPDALTVVVVGDPEAVGPRP